MKVYSLDRRTIIHDLADPDALSGRSEAQRLSFVPSRYEYFVVQLAAVSRYKERNLAVSVSAPVSESGHVIENAAICLNTTGTAPDGSPISREINLAPNIIQPLYFGFDLIGAKPEKYTSVITVGDKKIEIILKVTDEPVFNYGADTPETLARLKWLNSKIALDDKPLAGYKPIIINDKNEISFTGKTAVIGSDGHIGNVISYFDRSNAITKTPVSELFFRPIEFSVAGQKFRFSKMKTAGNDTKATVLAEGKSEGFRIEVTAGISYEGRFDYKVKLTAERDAIVEDASLNLYFKNPEHSLGFGKRGGGFAQIAPRGWGEQPFYNTLYVGGVNCGARIKLKDEAAPPAYLNRYIEFVQEPVPHSSWDNFGKGVVSLTAVPEGAVFTASAGKMIFKKGKSVTFAFELLLTPFRAPDFERAFGIKTYYKKTPPKSFKDAAENAVERGLNHITISAGFPENRYLGYPILSEKELKSAVSVARDKCVKLIYEYTGGMFIDRYSEYYALKNMGGELLASDAAAEVLPHPDEPEETLIKRASLPGGRAENYYAEGVNYLLTRFGADGILAKDMSVTPATAERVNKIIRSVRPFGAGLTLWISGAEDGRGLLDYADILPFVDRVIVESQNSDPGYVLTEVSGLIYGLTAENCGGYLNPHLAMLFGTGVSCGTNGEIGDRVAQSVYELWDRFGIKDARFIGYWDENNPVTSDKKEIRISCFIRGGDLLAVIYNSSDKPVTFDLGINPKRGYSSKGKKFYRPALVGLSAAKKINFNKPFYLKEKKGMFIIVSDKKI